MSVINDVAEMKRRYDKLMQLVNHTYVESTELADYVRAVCFFMKNLHDSLEDHCIVQSDEFRRIVKRQVPRVRLAQLVQIINSFRMWPEGLFFSTLRPSL